MASSKSDAGKVGQFKKRLQVFASSPDKDEAKIANQILGKWSIMSTEDKLKEQAVFEDSHPVTARAAKRRQSVLDDESNQSVPLSTGAMMTKRSRVSNEPTPAVGTTKTDHEDADLITQWRRMDGTIDDMLSKVLLGSSRLLEGGKQEVTLKWKSEYEFVFIMDTPDNKTIQDIQ